MVIPDISALNADGLDETFLRQCIEENDISGIAYAANMYNFDMNFLPDTPDTSDAPGTPLCLACKLGFLEAAKELVFWGARLESYTDEEPSPLIWAAKNGHIEVVKWLVEQGGDVNDYYEMTDNYGDIEWGATALTEALANGYIDIASILLNYGASPFIYGYREEINIADIQKKFGVYSGTIEPFFFCIQYKLTKLIEQMLPLVYDKKISILIEGEVYTPLMYSIFIDNYSAAQIIINAGCDIDEDIECIAAIDIAIAANKIEYVRLLLNNGLNLLKIDCENEFVFEKICNSFPELSHDVVRNMAIQLHKFDEHEKYF